MAERPTGSPLHGKRVYAYVGQTDGDSPLEFVSFATDYSVNLTPQNTARAVSLGSDAVADVEVHGIVARARLNLLLTSTEQAMLLALSSTVTAPASAAEEVDYDTAALNLISNTGGFTNAARLDVLIAPLENAPIPAAAGDTPDLTTIRSSPGYVIELNAAAIVGLEITGRVGEYNTARLEVESGRFEITVTEAVAP